MTELNFELHEKQLEVLKSKARFKVVAAGRRAGKSYLACIMLILEALKDKNEHGIDLKHKEVFYVAPTLQQARDIMWNLLKDLGKDVIRDTHENTSTATLVNGRRITLKGSDRPDSLRGVSVSFVVMDEYAFMRPETWDLILRPTLADSRGSAMFIGTPSGKNHFYHLWTEAGSGKEEFSEWEAFHFNSLDNPILAEEEINHARATMSHQAFRQEFEASFSNAGGGAFKEDDIQYGDEPDADGFTFVAVDPNGFTDTANLTKAAAARLDQTAIAAVHVSASGWFVHEIKYGRWGVRQTALEILRIAQKYHAASVGIEKGSLKSAIMPYLEDNMRRIGVYPNIQELTHGGKKKTERIMWALQGRFQHGKITFNKNSTYWHKEVIDQLLDFPNPLVHDDLIDALAYIDQISVAVYDHGFQPEEFEPLDDISGY